MNPSFPTDGFVRLPRILAFLDFSESTFRRGIRAGKFPKPKKKSIELAYGLPPKYES